MSTTAPQALSELTPETLRERRELAGITAQELAELIADPCREYHLPVISARRILRYESRTPRDVTPFMPLELLFMSHALHPFLVARAATLADLAAVEPPPLPNPYIAFGLTTDTAAHALIQAAS